MANLTRWDPFEDSFDDLVKGFFPRPMRLEQHDPLRIKVDVKEDATGYAVLAEIPGVKKDEIQVSVEGNQVAISAEIKRQKEEKQGEKTLRSERYYGRVARSFALSQDVDQEKAQAKYENGVLEMRLPKKAPASTRSLAVQ